MYSIEVHINLKDKDGSNFSYEERGLNGVYFAALTIVLIILLVSLYRYYKEFQLTDRFDNPIFYLVISVGLGLISLLLKKIHFHFYAIDGRGLVPLHVTAMIFEVASYFFIVILLILIACGWTLIYLVFKYGCWRRLLFSDLSSIISSSTNVLHLL